MIKFSSNTVSKECKNYHLHWVVRGYTFLCFAWGKSIYEDGVFTDNHQYHPRIYFLPIRKMFEYLGYILRIYKKS